MNQSKLVRRDFLKTTVAGAVLASVPVDEDGATVFVREVRNLLEVRMGADPRHLTNTSGASNR